MTITTKRIEYIDALRGLTMILVIFGHLYMPGISSLMRIITSFYMPLFFFISGYLAFKTEETWNLSTYVKNLWTKSRTLLIPTLLFGLTFSYLIRDHNIQIFITDVWKDGYWFTIVLLEMFFLHFTYNLIFNKLRSGGGVWHKNLWLYAFAILLYGLPYICNFLNINNIYNQVTNIISLSLLCQYFQFFVLGLLVRQFQNQAHEIIDNKYVSASIIILFVILYGWLQIDDQYINNSTGVLHKLLLLIDIGESWLVRYLGLIIVYAFFRKYQDSFTQAKPLGSSLQYIGRHTLDIYVLHYFFLPNIAPIKEYIFNTRHVWNSTNIVFELFIGISVSLMVIAVCLVVSKIIRTSDLLGHYLFGAKIKDAK